MRGSCRPVKRTKFDNSCKENNLTALAAVAVQWGKLSREVAPPSGTPDHGGDTASTGVKTRGMHAEPHRLVNPMEHNVTANTQLALAA